ncbi:alpha/beta fold hydrolase [Georgenia alba]|uniref:Alpha/beta fold hydrolase n=1 Tax=Georgenia alba TaxID=2233858 RepID=A0ABW2Q3V1_9MICO
MDILLIGGLWLDATVWDDVARHLEEHGHRAVPITLPGQGDGDTTATLADQVATVVAAVDAAEGKPLVVGHSAASSLAWLAADARPEKVAAVALVGGMPTPDGERYADFFPIADGLMPFPGWEPFDDSDIADLDTAAREAFAERAIPVPEGVARGTVSLTDERRYDVPVVMVCPEYTPAQAQEWLEAGHIPELSGAKQLTYADIDSGHWPMLTAPAELARILAGLTQ